MEVENTEAEALQSLSTQKQELKMDAWEVTNALGVAKAEEARLRELVEVYGQGQERAALVETRQQIAVLESAGKRIEAQIAKVKAETGAIEQRVALFDTLRRERALTEAQIAKLRAKLEAGATAQEVRELAAKWETANRVGALGGAVAPPEPAQAAFLRSKVDAIAQEFGLSQIAKTRLLSSVNSGALTVQEARETARKIYVSGQTSGATSATPKEPQYAFSTATDVEW